jgi:hypothetical protein
MRHGPPDGDPHCMSLDLPLKEIVLFELPSRSLAERLVTHLASSRLAWLQNCDLGSIVGVLLNPDELDLALVLRTVQAWLERCGLAAIRFELDGRMYVLEARRPAVAVC